MRIDVWTFLALSTLSLPAESVPFIPHDVVDTPAAQASAPNSEYTKPNVGRGQKRALNYSVVQVDGSSTGGAAPTVVQTVTRPASSALPGTKTVILTSVLSDQQSQETTFITRTEDVAQTIAMTPPAVTITVSSDSDQPKIETNQVVSTSTYLKVETVTSTPTSTTQYYDDGLWHTYYPMKNFTPDWSTSTPNMSSSTSIVTNAYSSPVYARGAAGTGRVPYPVAAGAAYPTNKLWHMRRDARGNVEARGTGVASPTGRTWEPYSRSEHPEIQERRAPLDLKVASWNITKSSNGYSKRSSRIEA